MNRKPEVMVILVVMLATVIFLTVSPLTASDVITITGEINDSNQIVAGELIFEVDDTPEGNRLVANYKNKKVKVTGKLIFEGDMRIIAVKEFELIDN